MQRFFWKLYFLLTRKRLSKLSGKIIVFEGIDGSGKETQFKLFIALLKRLRIPYKTFDFPQYETSLGGQAVKMALHGELGADPADFPIKGLSIYYSIDRGEAAPKIREAQQKHFVVCLNRYTTSHKGHQASKFDNEKEQEEFLGWVDEIEYKRFNIPREDIVIFFNISLKNALLLIQKRNRIKDKVEVNVDYLEKSLNMYRKLAKRYPHWITVKCEDEKGNLLSPEAIHKKVIEALSQNI
jgi:dTMP kinase